MRNRKELAILRGKRLKSALDRLGLKQADITRDGFISESQVSTWISGKVCVSEETLFDIRKKYLPSVRMEYLLGYDEFMEELDLTLNTCVEKWERKYSKKVGAVLDLLECSGYDLSLCTSSESADSGIYNIFSKKNEKVCLDSQALTRFSDLLSNYAEFMLLQFKYLGMTSLPPFFPPEKDKGSRPQTL